MHQHWKDRGNLKCTEQWLCDQKKQIEDKTLLRPAEIEEVKQQIKSDTFQEEEDPIPPTNHETPDDDDDFDQLKDEYLELLEEVKSQPVKERKKLSWKMTRNWKEWLRPWTR